MIAEALGVDMDASLSLSTRSQDKEGFLAIMAQFAGALLRDCETILHYFPGFIVERDKDVLSPAGLLNSLNHGRAEVCYQSALRTYSALTSHLYRIENTMARFGSFRKASTKSEGWATYAPLGASLAASVIFMNPLPLLGAAHQGTSLFNRAEAKSSIAAETLDDAFESCAREWDYLMQTLIPFVSNRFARDIYPVRLATADIFLKAYADGDAAFKELLAGIVAQRLGRLITFCEFPSAVSSEIRRSQCVDFLLKRQQSAVGIEERHF